MFKKDRTSDKVILVNPNYVHRKRITGAVAKCECGAVIGKANDWYEDEWTKDHTPECRVEWRHDALSRMWEKRRAAVVESALYLRSENYVLSRMGIDKGTLGSAAKTLGIARGNLRDHSRMYAKATASELKDKYTAPTLARIFNVHKSTVRRWW